MTKVCCAKTCYNTSVTNRTVSYFGFPKDRRFASAWALAADRSDILEKSIECITKYNLCADHFTDDCFADPNRKALKKTSRPVIQYPLPTIFKSNFHQYFSGKCLNVPNDSKPAEREYRETLKSLKIETVKRKQRSKSNKKDKLSIQNVINANLKNGKCSPSHSFESLGEVQESFQEKCWQNTTEDVLIDNNLENIIEYPVLYEENDNETKKNEYSIIVEANQIFDEQQINDFIEYQDPIDETCRLCLQNSLEPNQFYKLFVEDDQESMNLTEKIQKLLPNMISKDDLFPHQVCPKCVSLVESCTDTINSFRLTQNLFLN